MKFIDLFAGLGGFNLALSSLGHECVFASEIDAGLRTVYEKNFDLEPNGDIWQVDLQDIPEHDILCAGFPCQPFSKAGGQQGLDCPKWGNLFDRVLTIVQFRTPRFVLLENVPNLARHENGKTWQRMETSLRSVGYTVDHKGLSPHRFGVPQIRERIFIVGARKGLAGFVWPRETPRSGLSLTAVLDRNPPAARRLSDQVTRCLEVWQDFLSRTPADQDLPSFPIWSMEFGADYPYERTTPSRLPPRELRKFRGCHGRALSSFGDSEIMLALPSYARSEEDKFPGWKIEFIRQNREFYRQNRKWIDPWMPGILEFPPSLQKLEWNCKGEERDIWRYVIQFRASGVRVKRPTTAPSLIAMTSTQVPIVGWERRYLTPRECARLQSMEQLLHLPDAATPAFRALGNAVNVSVAKMVAEALLCPGEEHPSCVSVHTLEGSEEQGRD